MRLTLASHVAWSLRDIFAMECMARPFHPEEFADSDPVKGLAAFHARFLPVPFSGTWSATPDEAAALW